MIFINKIILCLLFPVLVSSVCYSSKDSLCVDLQGLSICEKAIDQYHIYSNMLLNIAQKSDIDVVTYEQYAINLNKLLTSYNNRCRGRSLCYTDKTRCISADMYDDCIFLKQNITSFNSKLNEITPNVNVLHDAINSYSININCNQSLQASSDIYGKSFSFNLIFGLIFTIMFILIRM